MKKILCVALALVLMLCLSACSVVGIFTRLLMSSTESEVGTYRVTRMEMDGQSLDRAAIAQQIGVSEDELDDYILLVITEEGSALLTLAGIENEMGYDDSSIWPLEYPDEKADFSLRNGKAIIAPETYTLTFEK
jgi:hypothetical protein